MTTSLQHGRYYHIYNRGNNSEVLFKSYDNYILFLKQYSKYISPIADTYAYCLMSNHFHLVIRIKDEKDILTFKQLQLFEYNKSLLITDKKPRPSSQFAHLFNSYSKTINKSYHRTGSLFEHPFERRLIEDEDYLKNCIYYVHNNPVKHGYVENLRDYPWSSYKSILSDKPTELKRDFILQLFGGKENFKQWHSDFQLASVDELLAFEDEKTPNF